MKIIFLTTMIVFSVFFSSCQMGTKTITPSKNKVVVEEVLQANEYTYLRVKENDKEMWMAIPKMEAQVGETYYYKGGYPMTDFKSKDLNRTFDEVIFLEGLSKTPILDAPQDAPNIENPHANQQQPQKPNITKSEIKVEHNNGEISISEMFQNKEKYAGQVVKVKGVVVKYSSQIMNKNWVHLQDGTDFNGKFDLTITTNEEVKVNDTVTFEGPLSVGKDFGYGYFYEIIIEDAKIIK